MDDRDLVAAIVAGDVDGIASAYDQHSASLYGYCHSVAPEPADAAVAVQDTFIIAAARLDALRDPRKLRPWLYAVARCQCRHPDRPARPNPAEPSPAEPSPAEPNPAEPADVPPSEPAGAPPGASADTELARNALRGLHPAEREVIELSLGHHLVGSDLAAVLGVSRSQAHALVARARGHLERSLGAPLAVRADPQACPALGTLLAGLTGGDGRLTALMRKRIGRHLGQCEACADRVRAELDEVIRSGLERPPAPPPALREEVLRLCAKPAAPEDDEPAAPEDDEPAAPEDDKPASPEDEAYREWVIQHAGQFGPSGFPRPVGPPRRIFTVTGAAAAAGILVAAASTGIVSLLTLGSPHVPGSLDAAHTSHGSTTARTGATGNVVATRSATITRSAAPASGSVSVGAVPSVSWSIASPTWPGTTSSPSRTPATSSPSGSSKAAPSPSSSPSASPAPTPSASPSLTPTPTPPSPGGNWPPPSTPPATGIP